jgi:hypothetical protein
MGQLFFGLVLLACPVGMGLMMWFMMRGTKSGAAETSHADAPPSPELARLQAEVDQLKAAERDRGPARPARDTAP